MATLLNEQQWAAVAKVNCDSCADKDGCDQVKYDCPKMCFKTLTHDAQGYLGEEQATMYKRKFCGGGACKWCVSCVKRPSCCWNVPCKTWKPKACRCPEYEKKEYLFIGSYTPATENSDEVIERGGTEQGMVFKDEDAFLNHTDKVCYIPELHDTTYTRQDFLDECGGRADFAALCFEAVDWQSPSTWVQEQFTEGEWGDCDKCGWFYDLYNKPDGYKCENCGAEIKDDEDNDAVKQLPLKAQLNPILGEVRRLYPKGARVELVKMKDPYTKLKPGDKGTVEFIDDASGIHIRWDSGEGLAAIFGVDIIKVVEGDAND